MMDWMLLAMCLGSIMTAVAGITLATLGSRDVEAPTSNQVLAGLGLFVAGIVGLLSIGTFATWRVLAG